MLQKNNYSNMIKIFLFVNLLILSFILQTKKESFADDIDSSSISEHINISGEASMVSNYIFRSMSQTGDNPAIQNSMELKHKNSGIYMGYWGSTVDFKVQSSESIEIDWYGGYKNAFKFVNLDVGIIYYNYPGTDNNLKYDFYEGYIDLSNIIYESLEYGINASYSRNYFGGSGVSYYPKFYINYTLNHDISFSTSVAYQEIHKEDVFGYSDYVDWLFGITYNINSDMAINLLYTDNDISSKNCKGICGSKISAVLSLFY